MNITSWELYWIFQLDQIRDVFVVICFFSALLFAVLCVILLFTSDFNTDNDMRRNLKKTFVCTSIVLTVSMLLVVFIPTTRQLMVIKVMPVLMNTESAQKELTPESAELYGLVKQYLRETMNKEVEK